MLFASIMELIKRILKVNAKLENFKKNLTRLFVFAGVAWIAFFGYSYYAYIEEYGMEIDREFLYGVLVLLLLWIIYVSIILIANGFIKELIKRILKVGAKLESFKDGLTRLFIVAGGFWVTYVGYAYNDGYIAFFEEDIYHFSDFLFYATLGLLSLCIIYVSIIWIVKGFIKEQ